MTDKDASQWYIARDGKRTGPMSDLEIKAIAAHKYFRATDLVWCPSFTEWRPALSVFAPAPETPPQLPVTAPPVTAAPKPMQPQASANVTANTERTAPRAPQPQPQSDAARLPVSPPYRSDPATRPAAPRETTAQPAAREPTQQPQYAPQSRAAGPQRVSPPQRSNRAAIITLTAGIAAVSAGIWATAHPGLLRGIAGGLPQAQEVADGLKPVAQAQPGSSPSGTTDLDARWQQTAHWQVIKREFPDWYGERLREAAKLSSENKPETEITRTLVEQMIALRRQNATLALSASTPKLKALANAFLDNLKQLKAQSTTACFNFISQGEGTPGLFDQFKADAAGSGLAMQLQVAAIFDAIGDGRKTPVTHEKPLKADYDVLMDQLSKLGWSQADVATFADPKALARAEPARVCQMVQDWFVAHISIVDEATQERLLSETLRPVVSG